MAYFSSANLKLNFLLIGLVFPIGIMIDRIFYRFNNTFLSTAKEIYIFTYRKICWRTIVSGGGELAVLNLSLNFSPSSLALRQCLTVFNPLESVKRQLVVYCKAGTQHQRDSKAIEVAVKRPYQSRCPSSIWQWLCRHPSDSFQKLKQNQVVLRVCTACPSSHLL